MAVLDVIKVGAPVLKQVAEPVEFVNKKIRQLLDDMAVTMYTSDGVGLAAPQVNVSKRIIVVDDGEGLREFINPVITKGEGCQLGLEGCLSVPGYFGDVKRYQTIEVQFIDRNNKKKKIKASGFLARIIQHEIDHLDGILFIEKVETAYEAKKEEKNQLEEMEQAVAEVAKAESTNIGI
ncbi:peptide deformylase [uncultured Veillonella sp.]|uniref:peptide deformylase n=1 Tax=uncultured Veillonella sp. TaxID=159268 RepID=UPI002601754F|nr:peptide deformylase [uncultured Veillonella sp.]